MRDAKVGHPDEQSFRRNDFIQWRYNVPLNPLRAQPLGPRLSSFVQAALDLISIDPGITQEVILTLNSEGGFLRMKELLERDFKSMSESERELIVTTQMVPFFQIITHPDVAASIMLEDKVHSIFNFLYGRQGERGVEVFTLVADTFAISKQRACRSVETLESVLGAFSSMIDVNTNALVNDQLPRLAELLIDFCQSLEEAPLMQLCKLTTKIARRLDLRHAFQNAETVLKPPQTMAKFVLPHDLPGKLSIDGPRHDNDHANIQDISILPTLDEIRAIRPPYLPSIFPEDHHLTGVEGLLDRHFRLLREDTVGQLRDAICGELEKGQAPRRNAARFLTYDNLIITNMSFSRWKGLQIMIRIRQPQHLRQSTYQSRKDWWEHTNRLQLGALVCMIGYEDSITFCTVSELSHKPRANIEDDEQGSSNGMDLFSDPDYCYIQLQLASPSDTTRSNFLQQLARSDGTARLVEFPGVLLPSFEPTLKALQSMSKRNDLPFSDHLAPADGSAPGVDEISAPSYATRPGFQFELGDVMTDKSSMKLTVKEAFDIEKFKSKTELDDAQADALISCLKRSFSLIQGPPGTGKSFTGIGLIKILLAAKQKANLGPVLCVCYTNHALDQLLEHLVHHKVSQIIRVGSRSKSEVLEKCNLRTVAQNMDMTNTEKKSRWEVTSQLVAEEAQIQDLLEMLLQPGSRKAVKEYLFANHPGHHDAIFDNSDDDGFTTVYYGQMDEVQRWLRGEPAQGTKFHRMRTLYELQYGRLFDMNQTERHLLFKFWVGEIRAMIQEKLLTAIKSHEDKKLELDRIQHEQQLRCLQMANVIGVTTTGLARQLKLLYRLWSMSSSLVTTYSFHRTSKTTIYLGRIRVESNTPLTFRCLKD